MGVGWGEGGVGAQWENTVGAPSKGGLTWCGEYGPSLASALTWKISAELQQEPAPEPR